MFKKFPTVDLMINGKTLRYDDIYRFVNVDSIIADSSTNYDWYEIADGERPDHVSYNMYKSSQFYWTFFIVNERLKKGMSEWPLSENALEKHIEEKYSKYGIVSLVPTFFGGSGQSFDMMEIAGRLNLAHHNYALDMMNAWEIPAPITNVFNGIDLTHPYIRIRRKLSKQHERRHAKIAKWDATRYQLWLEEVNDPFFFRTVNDNVIDGNTIELFLINPVQDEESSEYAAVEEQNAQWTQKTIEQFGPDIFTHDGSILFYVDRFYDKAENAPERFIDQLTDETFVGEYVGLRGGVPIPYYEHERALNTEKRKIRVIRPELVRSFVEKYYNVLLLTGRL